MKHNLTKIILNFSATLLLLALIALPFYFARNFAQVAGVKTQAQYLVVSQVEKFPGMKFTQVGDNYQISFDKLGSSQAYLGILIVNNPTNQTKTYELNVSSGESKVFFGENLDDQLNKITVPATASVPISLYSSPDNSSSPQSASFQIQIIN